MNCPSEQLFFGSASGKGWPSDRHARQHALTNFEIALLAKDNNASHAGSNALLKMHWGGEYVDEVTLFQVDDLLAFGFAVEAVCDTLMITPQSWPEMFEIDDATKLSQANLEAGAHRETSETYLLFECRGTAKLRDRLRANGEWVEFEVRQRPQLVGNVTRPSSVSVTIRTNDEILFDIPVFDTDALSAFRAGVRLVCTMVTINPNDF